MTKQGKPRRNARQERTCRVWWHPGYAAWVWRCWDCREPGQTCNGRADSQPQALAALEAHFYNGQGLKHNTTKPASTANPAEPATREERWAA